MRLFRTFPAYNYGSHAVVNRSCIKMGETLQWRMTGMIHTSIANARP